MNKEQAIKLTVKFWSNLLLESLMSRLGRERLLKTSIDNEMLDSLRKDFLYSFNDDDFSFECYHNYVVIQVVCTLFALNLGRYLSSTNEKLNKIDLTCDYKVSPALRKALDSAFLKDRMDFPLKTKMKIKEESHGEFNIKVKTVRSSNWDVLQTAEEVCND